MTYYKIINNQIIKSDCKVIKLNGHDISNPTPEMIAEAGWQVWVPPARTLEDAKRERIAELNAYDQSSVVLSFSLNNIDMWVNPTERTNYLMTVEAAEDNGMTTVPFHGTNISTIAAKNILNAVALYAMQVMAVTDNHRETIEVLENIEDVDAYDYTVGYPTKLVFNL